MSDAFGHIERPLQAMLDARQLGGRQIRALVTGGSGYIGSRLIEKLIADGWQVHAILRPSSSLSLLGPCAHRITIHRHHGSTNDMLGIIAAARPDVVFHVAALAVADHRPEDVDRIVVSNVLYSTQLVEGMIRNDVRNLVHTETFWQYCADSGAYDPVCLYAATKQAFRDILLYYAKSGAIQAISLVLFDTYGPGDPRRKLFNLLKQASHEARAIDMTPGEQIVDMTHVKDVVEAYIHAGAMLFSGQSGKLDTYAATSGRRMTLKELVNLVERATGMSLNINWGGRPYRANEIMVPWLGQPLPGWRPRVDLETGIREFFCT